MVSIKHKVRVILQTIQARFEGGISRLSRRVSARESFIQRVFDDVRSRRMLFRSIKKRHVSTQSNRDGVAIDVKRRAFVKYAVFGGVVFLAGKYVTPLVNTLRGDTVLSEKTLDNFKMVETGKQLQISDDDGNEILTIDKEGF